jgi:hypothetical protein
MTHRSKMTERFICRLPQLASDSDPAEQVVAILIGHGLQRADAHRLVANELKITPIIGIRKFTELLEGHAGDGGKWIEASKESKVAGAKLIDFLLSDDTSCPQPLSLTEKERKLVIEHSLDVAVREGFVERVAGYVTGPDQLAAILMLFAPTVDSGECNP